MDVVTRDELERFAPIWDARVASDSDLDPFCARSAWSLSFHDAFEPDRPLYRIESSSACVILAESRRDHSVGLLEPLENMWGFSSPLIGREAIALLAEGLAEGPRPVLLLGIPALRDRLEQMNEAFMGHFWFRRLEPTPRFVASLEGGREGWLSRRRPSLRRNLRASDRRRREAGLTYRRVEPSSLDRRENLYEKILDVESRSWKGRTGQGVDQEPMRSFYADLLLRLQRSNALRAVLVEREGKPMGYLYGARIGEHFRGLQFSYDEQWRSVGLGNLLQLEMITWLSEERAASYDLGGQSAYKRRWAEEIRSSENILLIPKRS